MKETAIIQAREEAMAHTQVQVIEGPPQLNAPKLLPDGSGKRVEDALVPLRQGPAGMSNVSLKPVERAGSEIQRPFPYLELATVLLLIFTLYYAGF